MISKKELLKRGEKLSKTASMGGSDSVEYYEGYTQAVEDLREVVEALEQIAYIGVVHDYETGEKYNCHPIEVSQVALSNLKAKVRGSE